MARDGEVKQRQHFCHHGDTILPSKVRLCNNQTARNERLHVDATIMRSFQTVLCSSFLPSTYAGNGNLAAAKPWLFMPNWKDGSTVEFIIFCV